MKKVIAMSLVLLGVVFLAGCGQQPVSQSQPTTPAPVAQAPMQPVATQPANNSTEFKTLREVVNTNKSYVCSYIVHDLNQYVPEEITIHGLKYHFIVKMNSDVSHIVYDGNTVYSWSEKTGKGFFMDKDCLAGRGKKLENFSFPTYDDVLRPDTKCKISEKEDFSKPIGQIYFTNGCSEM